MAARTTKKSPPLTAAPMSEIGYPGAYQYGGRVNDEFIPELSGYRGNLIYRQMRENDSMIGAIFYAMEKLASSVEWYVDPHPDEEDNEDDVKFLDEVFFKNDMDHSFMHFLLDTFTTLQYGWSFFEVTYKLRRSDLMITIKEGENNTQEKRVGSIRVPASKFEDGAMGIKGIKLLPQDTLHEWHLSERGQVLGMSQLQPIKGDVVTVKITKALHLVSRPHRGSPQGMSLLRNAYRDWDMKRKIENIEVEGIDRDLTGLPIVKIPSNLLDGSEKNQEILNKYVSLSKEIRTNQASGIVVPSDMYEDNEGNPTQAPQVSVELLSSPGQRTIDVDATIRRKDRGIARSILCDFMTLGGEAHGSFALSHNLSSLFITSLTSWLDIVAQEINRQIVPMLWSLNGRTTPPPIIKHGQIVPNDLEVLGGFLQSAVTAGLITLPDRDLENSVRSAAGMPSMPDQEEQEKMMREKGEIEADIEGMKAKAKGMDQQQPGGGKKGAEGKKPGAGGGKPGAEGKKPGSGKGVALKLKKPTKPGTAAKPNK